MAATSLVSPLVEISQAEVAYLCSSRFCYSQLICGDAGPAFATDYGWRTVTLDTIRDSACEFVVVDNRLDSEEMANLRTIIQDTKTIFILRSADPYWEHRDQPWYRFVAEMLDTPRVHILLNYQPAEINALFASRARWSQFIFAPYVYREDNELPIDHACRENRILISGAMSKQLYPLRTRMLRVSQLWPPLRLMTKVLRHPGYPDIGPLKSHPVIGRDYIAKLAKYRFASVCSSRCRLEFLKYREFAYAGVVPVGDMPATLLDAPEGSWIPWRSNFIRLTSQLAHMVDSTQRAERFRQFMRSRRNQRDLQMRVTEQLARLK